MCCFRSVNSSTKSFTIHPSYFYVIDWSLLKTSVIGKLIRTIFAIVSALSPIIISTSGSSYVQYIDWHLQFLQPSSIILIRFVLKILSYIFFNNCRCLRLRCCLKISLPFDSFNYQSFHLFSRLFFYPLVFLLHFITDIFVWFSLIYFQNLIHLI